MVPTIIRYHAPPEDDSESLAGWQPKRQGVRFAGLFLPIPEWSFHAGIILQGCVGRRIP
jgi:hypothetical protein